ncbi:MAG: preprotein translocase subunit SecE [Solirubrobacteraceae bacterium]
MARNRKRHSERLPYGREDRAPLQPPVATARRSQGAEGSARRAAAGDPEPGPGYGDDPLDVDALDDDAGGADGSGGGGSGGRSGGRSGGDADEGRGGGGAPGQSLAPMAHPGSRLIGFLQGSWRELQRVQWPDRPQVMQATGVVIGFVIVAGAFLGAADWVATKIVHFLLS